MIAHAAENGRGVALIASETAEIAALYDQWEDIDRLIADADAVATTTGLALARSVASGLRKLKGE